MCWAWSATSGSHCFFIKFVHGQITQKPINQMSSPEDIKFSPWNKFEEKTVCCCDRVNVPKYFGKTAVLPFITPLTYVRVTKDEMDTYLDWNALLKKFHSYYSFVLWVEKYYIVNEWHLDTWEKESWEFWVIKLSYKPEGQMMGIWPKFKFFLVRQ